MKIENYLKKQKLTLHKFSQMCGIEWSAFYRAYNSKFISLWVAKRIVETSNEQVTYDDLLNHKPRSIRRKTRNTSK